MNSENRLRLVKTLTRLTVGTFSPEKQDHFEDEFAAFALTAGTPQVQERAGVLRFRDPGLDTTLVAGMFFQVLVEAEQLPASIPERVSYVRRQAKNYLVNRLAGQISLSQFFRLLHLIDEQVHHYFAHLRGSWTNPAADAGLAAGPSLASAALRTEPLRQALARLPVDSPGRRKLTREKLMEFLLNNGTGWFRLLDFETFFRINKKTAWACLSRLVAEGILTHNGEKANKVRYTLASRFRRDPAV